MMGKTRKKKKEKREREQGTGPLHPIIQLSLHRFISLFFASLVLFESLWFITTRFPLILAPPMVY